MLLPNDALIGWAAIAVPTAIAVWRWPRNRVIWLGLAIAAAGFVYAYAVMANRPHNYYAILEVYAGGFAMAVGCVMIFAKLLLRIGVVRLDPRTRIIGDGGPSNRGMRGPAAWPKPPDFGVSPHPESGTFDDKAPEVRRLRPRRGVSPFADLTASKKMMSL